MHNYIEGRKHMHNYIEGRFSVLTTYHFDIIVRQWYQNIQIDRWNPSIYGLHQFGDVTESLFLKLAFYRFLAQKWEILCSEG